KSAENEIKDVKLKSYNRSLISLRLTKLKIESYLDNLRDKITIETFRHQDHLNDIFSSPEQHAGLLALIQGNIRQQLPNANTSTLANQKGEPLLPDFDGFIGESCERNLQQFASKNTFEIRVHPNMNIYHFDIMVKFDSGNNGSPGIFFTSFTTDKLKSILKQGETEQNQLFLLFNEVEGLIEVSSMGSRLELDREMKLTDDELNRLSISEAIKNTSWTLVNLPDKNTHHNVINRIIELTLFKILLLYIISASLIYIIYTEIKNRRIISDRYQLFLEKTDIAFLVFDEQETVHTLNNAMLKMSGKKSKKSILESNLKQWVNTASLQKIKAQLAQVDEQGQMLNLRVERLVENDVFQPMQIDIILDRSSEGKRYALFCKDLSQIYHIERLNQEKQAAIISDKQKSAFLANVSHELRTPMHGILSYSAMGMKRTHTVSLDKLKQYFTNINL
ncbi:MAG: hypothetical protein KAU21_11325, partial [Gammaproteobacteria bacterium]|nr:hypothetical protein [Gammaproteobacteria bacterium]